MKRFISYCGAAACLGIALGLVIHTRRSAWGLPETVAFSEHWQEWTVAVILVAAGVVLVALGERGHR